MLLCDKVKVFSKRVCPQASSAPWKWNIIKSPNFLKYIPVTSPFPKKQIQASICISLGSYLQNGTDSFNCGRIVPLSAYDNI